MKSQFACFWMLPQDGYSQVSCCRVFGPIENFRTLPKDFEQAQAYSTSWGSCEGRAWNKVLDGVGIQGKMEQIFSCGVW